MSKPPRVISLDIETYGCIKNRPNQNYFHPMRSLHQDGVPLSEQIVNIAITVPEYDPRVASVTTRTSGSNAFLQTPPAPWNLGTLQQLKPGVSFHLNPALPSHRNHLVRWLQYADTIVGMNILFDVLYLRRCYPRLVDILSPLTHFLIDLQIIMYNESEIRPERSLKDIGIVLGTHRYSQSAADKFDTPAQSALYCCEDTHNTLLAIPPLCQRMRERYPDVDKLNAWTMTSYSDALWECLTRSENGVPYDYDKLYAVAAPYSSRIKELHNILVKRGILISGTGSKKSKEEYRDKILGTLGEDILDHPLLERTKKLREISMGRTNRNLFLTHMDEDHPERETLLLWEEFSKAQKIYSTYIHALLWHTANHPTKQSSKLIPLSNKYRVSLPGDNKSIPQRASISRIGTAYPTWFVVPSFAKDGAGLSGGTKQIRETCKGPAIQTQPKIITRAISSAFPHTGRIVSFDVSQAELRTAALLSGDPTLCTAYQNDVDLHAELAVHCEGSSILNDSYFHTGDNVRDARQHYKQANFLILFRGQAQTLATTLLTNCGVVKTLPWCHDVISGLKNLRSGLWEWQNQLIESAHKRGYLDIPIIGVTRIFAGGTKFDENEIVNTPVQGLAALAQQRLQVLTSKRLGPASVLNNSPIRPLVNVFDSCKYDVASDAHERELTDIVVDATNELVTTDLWGMLQDQCGRSVPLIVEKE